MPQSASTAAPPAGDDAEICAVCGRDAGGSAFCHLFNDGHRIVLCSPTCAEVFIHAGGAETVPEMHDARLEYFGSGFS